MVDDLIARIIARRKEDLANGMSYKELRESRGLTSFPTSEGD